MKKLLAALFALLLAAPAFAQGVSGAGGGGSSGGVTAGTQLTQLLTGTGNAGSTFAVNVSQTITTQTIVALSAAETKFYATSSAQVGGLVKISSWTGTFG